MRATTVKFRTYDSEDRAVAVEVILYPGRPATRDYPGDAPDIDVVSVTGIDPGADCDEVEADEDRLLKEAQWVVAEDWEER